MNYGLALGDQLNWTWEHNQLDGNQYYLVCTKTSTLQERKSDGKF